MLPITQLLTSTFFIILVPKLIHGKSGFNLETHFEYGNGAFVTECDRVLPEHTIASVFVPSMLSCNHKCLAEPHCVSFNYQLDSRDGVLGLCELKDIRVSDVNSQQSLRYKPGYMFVQIYAKRYMPTSCLAHSRNGALRSGLYSIYGNSGTRYQVYCDLTSEPEMAWTLVLSQTFNNRQLPQWQDPLFLDSSLNQESPQWDAYRPSLSQMNQLKSVSTHWRVTCNFDTEGLQYRDYVRARFIEFDSTEFTGKDLCRKVEYLNLRGHNCTGCTAVWWQFKDSGAQRSLHHDSSINKCEFGSTDGYVTSEDNFGQYGSGDTNPQFRCTSGDHSSTSYWFGGNV